MILVAAMPLSFALGTWDHSTSPALAPMRQFALPATAIAILVTVIAMVRLRGLGPAFRKLKWPAWLGLSIVMLVAGWSAHMAEAAPLFAKHKTVVNLIILLFGFALAGLLNRSMSQEQYRFERVVLVGFWAYLIVVIAYIATAPSDFRWSFFGLTAQNIRNLGSHMMTVGAFSFGAMLVWSGRWKVAAAIAGLTAVAILAWSGSRGPYFILLAAVLAAGLLLERGSQLRSIGLIVGIFVAASALSLVHHVSHPAFGFDRILNLASVLDSGSDASTGRLAVWSKTWELLKTMPWHGYGDGQFNYVYEGPRRLAFPHNVILQLWFQWGWIGGSIAIVLLTWLGIAALKRTIAAPQARLPGMMMLFTIGAYGMIDGPFYDTLPMLFFAIAAALCFTPLAQDCSWKNA